MGQRHLKSVRITCNSSFSACDKWGELQKALHLVRAMGQGKVETCTIAFYFAISACLKDGEWAKGLYYICVPRCVYFPVAAKAAYEFC